VNTVQRSRSNLVPVMWLAVALATFTALAYLLMVWNVLGVGDLQMDEKPAGIIYFAAGCYLVGGLLILLRKRWLLLFGAFINAMVVLFFFSLYQNRPAVIFSPGGMISKILQIALEIALIYVIVLIWKSKKNENPGH
jgi:hypothetical protein